MNSCRNIIRLSSSGEVSIHEFPEGMNVCKELARLIGEDCRMVERIRPERLYSVFKCQFEVDPVRPGVSISMLGDEEFLMKEKLPEVNLIASWLYGTDLHKNPILGNVLFVGERRTSNGDITFCGLDDFAGLSLLCNLNTISSKLKKMEAGGKKYVLRRP